MIRSWVELRAAGVPVGFNGVLGMAIRKSLDRKLVSALIAAHKADLDIPTRALEAHALAQGRPGEVVKAALQLERLDEQADYWMLAALDLQHANLPELVGAYGKAKGLHPSFNFDEYAERFLSGEDVIAAAKRGDLRPLSKSSGWQMKIEYGPLSIPELNVLLERVDDEEGTVSLKRPGSESWEPAERMRGHLQEGASARNGV